MNKLCIEEQSKILSLLIDCNSLRAIERTEGATVKTITKLLVDAGERAKLFLDIKIRNVNLQLIQIDEIWTFLMMKQKNVKRIRKERGLTEDEKTYGDYFIYVAMDPYTKLVLCYHLSKRNKRNTFTFIKELEGRLSNKTKNDFLQISSDGYTHYKEAIKKYFKNVHYGRIMKEKKKKTLSGKRTKKDVLHITKESIIGNPVQSLICTSHVERQNLTIRASNKRMSRKTNAYTKKLENLSAQFAIFYYYYNFMRIHSTLRMTPAMMAGITDRIWNWEDLMEGDWLMQEFPD